MPGGKMQFPPQIRINGQWLGLLGEGFVQDSNGTVIARSVDVSPADWHLPASHLPSPKEKIMSTAVIEITSGQPLVDLAQKERFSDALLRIAKKPVSGVRRLWGVVVNKLHLNSFMTNYVRPAIGWVSAMLSRVGAAVGWVGGLGMGMVAVSTPGGRWLLDHTVGFAARLAGKAVSIPFGWLQKGLDHLGRPGKFVNNVLDTVVGWGASAAFVAKGFFQQDFFQTNSIWMKSIKRCGWIFMIAKLAMWVANPWLAALVWIWFGLYTMGSIAATWFNTSIGEKQGEALGNIVTSKLDDFGGDLNLTDADKRQMARDAENERKMDEAKAAAEARDAAKPQEAGRRHNYPASRKAPATKAEAPVEEPAKPAKKPLSEAQKKTMLENAAKARQAMADKRAATKAATEAAAKGELTPEQHETVKAEAKKIADEVKAEDAANAGPPKLGPNATKVERAAASAAARSQVAAAKRLADAEAAHGKTTPKSRRRMANR
jgi:hypothetical protein